MAALLYSNLFEGGTAAADFEVDWLVHSIICGEFGKDLKPYDIANIDFLRAAYVNAWVFYGKSVN